MGNGWKREKKADFSSEEGASSETQVISRELGKNLAEEWRRSPAQLTIPDTLLSSEDIITVVAATGLISPFYTGGGRKSRLKKAAYEGRVGSKAYIYDEKNSPRLAFDSKKHSFLRVPKNSIVFVESDLDFRLPDFIALRFNLQIQHVHRGLLLGTGPLVDPGFWGKLCIPLHNLTDQDYDIPINEGLIWIEFTKTTLPTDKMDKARVALEATVQDEDGHWEIEKFLDKAASQYTGHKVPIRSSLPTMFKEANLAATQSAADAKSALEEAEKLRSLNAIAMVAAAVGLAALCITGATFLSNLSSRNEDLAAKLRSETELTHRALQEHVDEVDRFGTSPLEARASVPALRGVLARQRQEIVGLRQQVEALRTRINRIERQTAAEDQ